MITIDPDYARRRGYEPTFLGADVPLPRLSDGLRAKAAAISGSGANQEYELKYHHFSVVMNAQARLAFFAAVNYDASAKFSHARQGADRWVADPRIEKVLQAGNEFYTGNPLDRGHLVRRADAGWGATAEEAARASDDTFHFTNCTPQHEIFNQASKASQEDLLLWGNIEAHIARHAAADNDRLSIINGPVFRSTDRFHRGLTIPREFWKIVVYTKQGGALGAAAFIFSQEGLITDLPLEEFRVGPYRPFQITIRDVEARTKLEFGKLREADPLDRAGLEAKPGARAFALNTLDAIVT
jgi:endonuclease G